MRAIVLLMLVAGCEPESASCIENIGIDISSFTVDGYNDSVRLSSGSSSWTWTCPGGGTAAITGTVTNPSTVNYNLTWNFTSCSHEGLTLTGRMQDTLSNGASGEGKTQSATSSALTILGNVSGCNADPIDATCEVSILYSAGYVVDVCGLSYP